MRSDKDIDGENQVELEITTDPSEAPEDCILKVKVEDLGGKPYDWYMDVHEMNDPNSSSN